MRLGFGKAAELLSLGGMVLAQFDDTLRGVLDRIVGENHPRVSSLDQNEGRQLEEIDLNRSFLDKAWGWGINVPSSPRCWRSYGKGTR